MTDFLLLIAAIVIVGLCLGFLVGAIYVVDYVRNYHE